jgi:G2/mitotic-specific cyclin 3/4
MIMDCCENPSKHHAAVFDKYTDRRFKRASIFVKDEMAKGFRLPSFSTISSRNFLPSGDDIPYDTTEVMERMILLKG